MADSDVRRVRITHPERALFGSGFTKADLAAYLRAMAPALLPQLADRPVTRVCYPDGPDGERYFVKRTPRWAPAWLRRLDVSASPGNPEAKVIRASFVDDLPGLEWMASQSTVEFHTPQWRVGPRGGIRRPDRLVIDLDPGAGVDLAAIAAVAHLVRRRLAADGLTAWPVTSGGRGIHLYAPLPGTRAAWAVHAYAHQLALELTEQYPDLVVARAGAEHRVGKVLLDWSQNHPARTTATPYSLRHKGPAPTVAAPREWEELGDGLTQLGPDDVVSRLRAFGDLMVKWGLTPQDH